MNTTEQREAVHDVFDKAWEAVHVFDDVLANMGFVQGIDEIAIWFDTDEAMKNFIYRAVASAPACNLFNVATDHVHTLPLKTCYSVQYNFLTLPEMDDEDRGRKVRLECMVLHTGFSPLHEALAQEKRLEGMPMALVHASFKLPDEEDYATANHRLREADWEAVQRCESTYGRFGYWQPLDQTGPRPLFLKPRVNLRDEQQALAL